MKKCLERLISASVELKFLVGFFYFSGWQEIHRSLKENDTITLKVLVGLQVDTFMSGIVEYGTSDENIVPSHEEQFARTSFCMDLLTSKYITYAISYEGVSRRETPTFPKAALRESLLNSIAHKDYASGVPVQISVYPDHIVFWNPGHLPDAIPMDTLLQKHPSIPYNPDIANTLFRSGDIEIWGRGYRKIMKAVLESK